MNDVGHDYISVYLDTNIIANWFLLYREGRRVVNKAERNAQECMRLLRAIKKGIYRCQFIISMWALAELAQVARDNKIAVKIIRDGQSLVFFNRLKHRYHLSRTEVREIEASLTAFQLYLIAVLRVKITAGTYEQFSKYVEEDGVSILRTVSELELATQQRLALEQSLEAPDSLHLAMVPRNGYFVTTDADLLEIRNKYPFCKIVRPSQLMTISQIKKPK